MGNIFLGPEGVPVEVETLVIALGEGSVAALLVKQPLGAGRKNIMIEPGILASVRSVRPEILIQAAQTFTDVGENVPPALVTALATLKVLGPGFGPG